ncbi:cytochrome ubiquinol oxidase subunit I [Massilibacterium senegalense]|uniref:cytochrome ubiquinol oxidase subunit I n=1 Tax=Massilibacterium senegalense TaxID=1632858 RepID=UPI000782D6E9|nr:cytochrome ubiquinol oxidase subunit I [Massilibacterium senegalense]
MDELLMTRSLFGTTMAFHIIFATMGVGLPVIILISEIFYARTNDLHYSLMAKRLIRAQAILLGVAIPSGTIASVQLSLLWPQFMEIVGEVIALPFQMEIFAFFLEAIFLSIYIYAADKLNTKLRIISVFFVALGAILSAVLITNVHSFEATPQGFDVLPDGTITNVDPIAAFFNPSFFITAYHVVTSALTTVGFIIAGISSYFLLKRHHEKTKAFYRKGLRIGMFVGGIFAILTALNGHTAAQMLHTQQPEKLAAAEGLFETQSQAPLAIFGVADKETETIKGAIEIPYLLSFLAGNDINTVVRGLKEFPEDEWPPLYIHTLFNGMVMIGSFLILLFIVYLIYEKRKKEIPRFLLGTFIVSGPLAMLSTEFGWIFSCVGRQPWTIYKVQKTSEAATLTGNIGVFFFLFTACYVLLLVTTAFVLYRYFKRRPIEQEVMKG